MRWPWKKNTTIRLPIYNIEVYVDNGCGDIKSDLFDPKNKNKKLGAALNAIESMILAHACSGIDVSNKKYIKGIQVSVDSIINEYGD